MRRESTRRTGHRYLQTGESGNAGEARGVAGTCANDEEVEGEQGLTLGSDEARSGLGRRKEGHLRAGRREGRGGVNKDFDGGGT